MNWLRRLATENVGLKLLSLALAVALWAAVGSDPVYARAHVRLMRSAHASDFGYGNYVFMKFVET